MTLVPIVRFTVGLGPEANTNGSKAGKQRTDVTTDSGSRQPCVTCFIGAEREMQKSRIHRKRQIK